MIIVYIKHNIDYNLNIGQYGYIGIRCHTVIFGEEKTSLLIMSRLVFFLYLTEITKSDKIIPL